MNRIILRQKELTVSGCHQRPRAIAVTGRLTYLIFCLLGGKSESECTLISEALRSDFEVFKVDWIAP